MEFSHTLFCSCLSYGQSIFTTRSTAKICTHIHKHTHTQALSTFVKKLTYFKIKIHGNYTLYVYVHLCAFAFEPTHLFALVCMLYLHANVYCMQFVSCHPLRGHTRRWRRKCWYKLQNMVNFSMTSLIWY